MTKLCECDRYPGELLTASPKGHYRCRRCGWKVQNSAFDLNASDKICPKDHRIYLASPYTHYDPTVRQTRYELALYAASVLANAGYIVYSPIAYTHVMASQYDLQPTNSDWWVEFDRSFIENWATILAVLAIPGYIKSTGISKEKAMAEESNLRKINITMEQLYDISRTGSLRLA